MFVASVRTTILSLPSPSFHPNSSLFLALYAHLTIPHHRSHPLSSTLIPSHSLFQWATWPKTAASPNVAALTVVNPDTSPPPVKPPELPKPSNATAAEEKVTSKQTALPLPLNPKTKLATLVEAKVTALLTALLPPTRALKL